MDHNRVMDGDNCQCEGNERGDVSPPKPMLFLILLLLLELQNLLAQTLDLSFHFILRHNGLLLAVVTG